MRFQFLRFRRYSFQKVSPTPGDRRYPRPNWFRILRWGMRWWWTAFVFYLSNVIFNLWVLVAQDPSGLRALFTFSKVVHALLLDQLQSILEQHGWVTLPFFVVIALFLLLGRWAHQDQRYEQIVFSLRQAQEKEQSLQKDQQEKMEEQGGKVIKEVQMLHTIIDPRLPPPLDEMTARMKYLEAIIRWYSTVALPIGSLDALSLQAIFQPLKLRRDPLAAEDLIREKRRMLLGESMQEMYEEENVPQVTADNGEEALHKSPQGRMIVLGGPGTGKTVLLKYLVCKQAHEAKNNAAAALPLFISLPDLARSNKTLPEYFERVVRNARVPDRYAEVLWRVLESGQAFVCLDSLDEVPPRQRPEIIQLVNDLASSID